ncbi:MAG: InlB B-repeat-containing protein [Bacteroidales bacterium]|nr:InlB B-repeat-containing protein [Bacteroidales bacterium]
MNISKTLFALMGATLLSASALAETETPSLVDYDVNGDGTVAEGEQAYELKSADDLYWFANYVNQLGDNLKANAILANDIVVNTLEFKDGEIVTDGKNYSEWTPIGYFDSEKRKHYYYAGTFDGMGHTISGLYINEDNSDYIGLFSETGNNSTIKNVGVVDSYFKVASKSFYCVGSIAGSSNGKIINCYSNSTIVAPKYNNTAGGICGENRYGSENQNSYFVGSIICNDNSEGDEYEGVGGICGRDYGGQFVKCYYLDGCCQYTNGCGSAMTIIQFNSGEVTYNFGGDWGQDLSTPNTFPVLYGKKVYKYGSSYTNEKITDFDENGFHEISDGVYAYQEPEVIDGVFQIANAGNLYWFAEYVNAGHTTINAVLTNDIVVNENVLNDDGTLNIGMTFMEWTPIGYSYYDWDAFKNISMAYQGNFDGQGHIVSGLYLNNSNQDYVSLFGYNEGTIQNVGVVDSYFYGKYNVGGVCGCTDGGKIKNCFSSATVIGKSNVGGVCGNTQGNIENCYNIGSVSGIDNGYGNVYVGGVVGYDLASGSLVKNCYTTGIIKENGIKINKVLGDAPYGDPVNCYYLADTEDGKGGMTAEQFASGEVAYKLGDAFFQTIGKDALPVLDSKHDKVYKTSPCTIAYSNKENTVREHVFDENGFCRCGGYQTAEKNDDGYYKIANVGNLYWFAEYVNQGGDKLKANAILMDDIEVNKLEFKDGEIVTDGKDYRVWSPIGYYDDQHWDRYYYQGTFDGNGHTISGLYFNNSNKSNVGLFGYNEGTIKDVGIVDSYFYGKDYVGGVCGDNINGTIKNCYNMSMVSGNNYIGGVCGENIGTLENCYNMSMVSGNYYIGGVCGANCGTLENCHNIGAVSGNDYIGGVCGKNFYADDYDQTIITCYNMGKVSGNDYIGGVCGQNEGLRIINSYNTGAVSGRNYIGGISGDNYANSCGNEDVYITNCYNIGEVTGTEHVGSLAGDNNGLIDNCYYLLGDDDNAIQKTAEQFANGKVAKLLRDGEKGEVWGQDCSKENSLPDLSGKLFYKIEFVDTDLKSVKFDNSLGYTITEQPSKTGTTFSGWYNNPEFKGDVITSISANTVTENIKLYPKFIANKHNIVYYLDNAEYKKIESVDYGTKLTLIDNPTKEGYTFSNWLGLPETMPDNDVEVKGSFTINKYKVTFNIEGVTSSIDVTYNEKAIYSGTTPSKPEDDKNTYEFSGWKSNIDGITIDSPIKSAVTFTAQFKSTAKPDGGNSGNNKYKVTFNIEGVTSSIDVTYNEKAIYSGTTPSKPEDDKNTYEFSGWKSNIDGITIDSPIKSAVTFTAQFKSIAKPDGGNSGNGNNGGNGTPVSNVNEQTVKVWGYNQTIFIETGTEIFDSQIKVYDLNGRLIKSESLTSSHAEITINKKSVVIVVINKISYKVAL